MFHCDQQWRFINSCYVKAYGVSTFTPAISPPLPKVIFLFQKSK